MGAADVVLLWPSRFLTKEDKSISQTMTGWWHAFAWHSNPNVQSVESAGRSASRQSNASWPSFAPDNETMLVQPDSQPASGLRHELCSFWDNIHPVPYKSVDAASRPDHHPMAVLHPSTNAMVFV